MLLLSGLILRLVGLFFKAFVKNRRSKADVLPILRMSTSVLIHGKYSTSGTGQVWRWTGTGR
jgi:hypothetical protein